MNFCFRNDWTKTSHMRAIDFWVIMCYTGVFAALMEYIVVLHLTQLFNADDKANNRENLKKRLLTVHFIEKVTKFLLPFYNTLFPIIYFMLCTLRGAK